MGFKPMSDDEIDNEMLMAEGTYPFEVVDATLGNSSKGNEMISLELRVFDGANAKLMKDWLLAHHPMCLRKTRHFCDSIGILDAYESGELETIANSCIGRSGMCEIKHSDTDKYGKQAGVDDYTDAGSRSTARAAQEAPAATVPPDDDIPF